jgi:hypothetical protein
LARTCWDARIEAACRELGLDDAACAHLVAAMRSSLAASAGDTDGERLRAEIESARGERERLASLEREVLRLLGTASRDKLLHDLRNVLNNLALLREITKRPR